MPAKVGVAAESWLEHVLLVPAQHVDLPLRAFVTLLDVHQQASLLSERFLRRFKADERSTANIAGGDGGVEGHDCGGDAGREGRSGGNIQLGLQPADVYEIF